ncbi:EpsG family protein [Aquimarina hainanensis]|uniref:EpsG family protein n=1 Tax=Aquimarina hainanensis TaxID=1578017 RepID=A0ABW5NBC5_9FLAO
MIDFIPLEYYYEVYLYYCMITVLFILLHSVVLQINDIKNIFFLKGIGIITLLLLTVYIGYRPVSGKYFIDMSTYALHFDHYANGGSVYVTEDVFFHNFMRLCALVVDVNTFFFICAIIYIIPMYIVSKKYFKEYWFYSFFMFIIAFSFWTYGTNGIRNGLATSIFLLAVSFYNKKIIMYTLLFMSTLFHKSLVLPVSAFLITVFYNNPKHFLYAWLLATPISIATGSFWVGLFTSIGFGDDRLSGYLTSELDESIKSSGFRFDFLFYSSFPVLAGWYFIFKRKFEDKIYNQLFNTYLIANTFWVLVITANFSNRFAYLSWFLMSLIIVYPFLKKQFFKNQQLNIALVTVAYFGFTYLMFTIYYG